MDSIKLKRGIKEVTYNKVDDLFAVRLKKGKALSLERLEASCGQQIMNVSHVDSAYSENMEVFAINESNKLEDTMSKLRKASASEVITHMYSLDSTPGGNMMPTGTITIQFKPDTVMAEREKVLTDFGLEVLEELDFLPHAYTVRLTKESKENPLKIASKLQKNKKLVVAEPDMSVQVSLKHIPTDTLYREQWHLKNPGSALGLLEGADVKAEEAWEITRGNRNIVVCVMDDGCDLQHPDFNSPGKIVAPKDFGQNDNDPNPFLDDDNHGTACAGVAVAEENGNGVVGLASECALMPIRMSTWLSDNTLTELFQYAINNHADVISCSWSAGAWNYPLSTRIHAIIQKAATQGRRNGKGCVILFAAGNEDRPLDGVKDGVISHQGFALHPHVIAVGASNSLDKRSGYSNFGPELAICAPSSGSPGRGIVTTDRRGSGGYSSTDYTSTFGGTSSATPLAAGLAALLLSVNPDLSSAEIKQIMMETADKINPADGNYLNGHSELYGHGRINAQKAVETVAGNNDDQRLPESIFIEHRVNKPIPDPGMIEDSISFCNEVIIENIEVSVDIRHTWRGDLKLTLSSGNGTEIVLINRTGDSQDNIIRSFRSADEPGKFAPLIGQNAKGSWKLKIEDLANQDKGILAKWGIGITFLGG